MAGLINSDSLGLGPGETLPFPSKLMPTLGKPQAAAWIVVPSHPVRDSAWVMASTAVRALGQTMSVPCPLSSCVVSVTCASRRFWGWQCWLCFRWGMFPWLQGLGWALVPGWFQVRLKWLVPRCLVRLLNWKSGT